MATKNHIETRQQDLPVSGAGKKPCIRASGVTLRRIVLGGCLLFWLAVIAVAAVALVVHAARQKG